MRAKIFAAALLLGFLLASFADAAENKRQAALVFACNPDATHRFLFLPNFPIGEDDGLAVGGLDWDKNKTARWSLTHSHFAVVYDDDGALLRTLQRGVAIEISVAPVGVAGGDNSYQFGVNDIDREYYLSRARHCYRGEAV